MEFLHFKLVKFKKNVKNFKKVINAFRKNLKFLGEKKTCFHQHTYLFITYISNY